MQGKEKTEKQLRKMLLAQMKTWHICPLQMIQRKTDNAESIKWKTNSGNEELINHLQQV